MPVLALTILVSLARAQLGYGDKGIFPVYEESGQWVVFDKRPAKPSPLARGRRFLVIGTEGAQVFEVARTSGTFAGACREHKPYRLKAALLKGRRSSIGRPLIAKLVAGDFTPRGSRARYLSLKSQVGETTYAGLTKPLRESALSDARSGAFKLEDPAAPVKPEQVLVKIDFGAKLAVAGLKDPFVFVEETQIGAATRRCLRLADGDQLIGACAEMPRVLLAETDLLEFTAYDPAGQGAPYLLASTKTTPKWGDERWGFVVRSTGPRLFLFDAMDPLCRAGF